MSNTVLPPSVVEEIAKQTNKLYHPVSEYRQHFEAGATWQAEQSASIIAAKDAEIYDLKYHLYNAKMAIGSQDQEMSYLNNDLTEKDAEIKRLSELCETKAEDIRDCQRYIERLKEDKEAMSKVIAGHETTICDRDEEIERLKSEKANDPQGLRIGTIRNKFKAKLSEKDAEIEVQRGEIGLLKIEIGKLVMHNDDLRKSHYSKSIEIERLKKELEESQKEVIGLEIDVAALKAGTYPTYNESNKKEA